MSAARVMVLSIPKSNAEANCRWVAISDSLPDYVHCNNGASFATRAIRDWLVRAVCGSYTSSQANPGRTATKESSNG